MRTPSLKSQLPLSGEKPVLRTPDFFIVGAPKCGTTALNDYLREHPEIFIPAKKEIHFFGSDLVFQKQRLALPEYLSYFSATRDEKRVGESSVWYLYSQRAAAEIKEFCPSARIIIMLRNPVDMMHSLHSQRLFNDNEDIADFAEALAAEEERKRGLRLYKTALNTMGFFYRAAARYTQQVQRYFEVFGREQVHVIIFDDFTKQLPQVYRETCVFLEVNADFQPQFLVINANKRVRSKMLRGFLRYPPSTTLRLLRLFVPQPGRAGLKERLRRFNTKYEPRLPLDPTLRQRLQAELLPEVEELSQLLGRDLTHWCRK
jgi:hypothetical protein